ncbi:MAG TPA: 2OG-Fe(II) oxygenase [Polyangiaceae bacterium]|nr:2OG-Fe(II) oxygenase [Polyangiaceae bacterium]
MPLRTSHTRADAVGELRDALWSIYRGELDLLIVKDAVAPARMAEAVRRAEAEPERFSWTPQEDPRRSHDEQMVVLGQTLTPVSGFDIDMAAYHAQAASFRRALDALFGPDDGGFEAKIQTLLGRLGGGREVFSPPAADGTGRYTPATIRKLPPGCHIPVHCGNFFLESPGYAHLRQTVAVVDQLSFFFPMQTPEAGGELLVYDLTWGDPTTPKMAEMDMFDPRAIEAWNHERFAPEVGELLLFDGGRYFHKVSRVEGGRARWTIGGFVGFTKDHDRVVYWS